MESHVCSFHSLLGVINMVSQGLACLRKLMMQGDVSIACIICLKLLVGTFEE
jgi:hypothetical protein